MGECNYFFKMQFRNSREAKKALKPVGDFLKQMREVHDSVNNEKKFPLVEDYFKYIGHDETKGSAPFLFRRNGTVSIGNEDSPLYIHEDTLCYAGYDTWHLEDWTPLMNYLKDKFHPIRTAYSSEEDGVSSLDAMNLYNWEGIVRSLLKRKDLLPLLLRAHKDLDELLNFKMK